MKTGADFDKLVKERCEKIVHTLSVKGKEYRRNDNPFHNFDRVAERRGIKPADALYGMYMKHEQSINDIIDDIKRDGTLPSVEVLEEKIGDAINYLILLEGIIKRDILNPKSEFKVFTYPNVYAICKDGEAYYKGIVLWTGTHPNYSGGKSINMLIIHPFTGKIANEKIFHEYQFVEFHNSMYALNEIFNKFTENNNENKGKEAES